jgi:hypothetical protein
MAFEDDATAMAGEVEPSCQQFVNFVVIQQIAAEGQPDKMESGMEQRCVTEFLHVEKMHSLMFIDAC